MTIYKNIDRWDTREWARVIKSNKALQDTEIRLNDKVDDGGAILHDVYAGLYKADPQLRDDNKILASHHWIKDTMSALHDTSEWKELRERCRLNPVDAEVATCELIKVIEPLVPDLAKNPPPQDPHPQSQLLNMLGGQGGGQSQAKVDATALRRKMRKAAKDAIKEIDSVADAMYGLGCGEGDGTDSMTSGVNKLKLAKLLRDNDKLKRIAELAGKFRRIAAQTQKSKPRHGVEEIHNVTIGDDLARLVPAEMLNLAHPLRRLDMLRRMTEKQLLQYALRGRKREAKGPIIFCLDNSSSMEGEREIWSKACMLAIADIARVQKRALTVIHFNKQIQRIDTFESGKYTFTDLVESALFFSGGGTDFEAPLVEAIRVEQSVYKNADILFITDGECQVPDEFIDKFNKFKQERDTKCIGISIDGSSHTLHKFCDQIEPVYNMTGTSKAVEGMFSI